VLVEEPRYFSEFSFHKKKLIFHRASMKHYQQFLESKHHKVVYLDHVSLTSQNALPDTLNKARISHACLYDPVDHVLNHRLQDQLSCAHITSDFLQNPMFLCTEEDLHNELGGKKHYAMSSFYSTQRKRFNLLIENGKPIGGKWSFDADNRRPLPSNIKVPNIKHPRTDKITNDAIRYINDHFPDNPGAADEFFYPVTHRAAANWLNDFIENRLALFGPYEDAISVQERFLFHSVLSPLLNSGLLTPNQILDKVMAYSQMHEVPLSSLEGFIRQVIGWREFIRGVYLLEGPSQAQSNFWTFKRKLPCSFYTAQTGIPPVDTVIRGVLQNAYAHHIERLMILGNFMLLCEIKPADIYRWFSELFIDAYEWVMIPNIFGMSQYADGGRMTTKPYISGSNYIRKMSDFKVGPWCDIWDSLFWRFIHKHKKVFAANPRMKFMAVQVDRMDMNKLDHYISTAEIFLKNMS
jgi:deoxyribodipyrimidine photolyase-related protein